MSSESPVGHLTVMLEPAVRSTEAPSWYIVVVSPAVPGGYTVSDISDFTELSNVVSSRTATVIKTYHGNILAITKRIPQSG